MISDLVTKLGFTGGLGLVVGIMANSWIEPNTPEGSGLILVVSIVMAVAVGTIFSKLKKPSKENIKPVKKSPIAMPPFNKLTK